MIETKVGAGRGTKASMLLLVLGESQQGKVIERKWDRSARGTSCRAGSGNSIFPKAGCCTNGKPFFRR